MKKLTATLSQSIDLFGWSVSVSGDTIIVGSASDDHAAGNDAGSAYVFVRAGNDWILQANLIASDAASFGLFGQYVAISGDTAVITANEDAHEQGTDPGSAYIFVRANGTWTQQAKFTASDVEVDDYFGVSAAISGDTAVVGAYKDDHAGKVDAGSAYVFVRNGTVWTQQAKLIASDPDTTDLFGISVSISGDTIIAGAEFNDQAATSAGAAYVFKRTGTLWTQEAKLMASDAFVSDTFGRAVAIDGNTAVIGARWCNIPGAADAGAAYVFVRSGSTWAQQQKLLAANPMTGDYFGHSVAVSGDIAVIGAVQAESAGVMNSGAAYVFVRSGTTWTQDARIAAHDPGQFDFFGQSVSVSGNIAVAGAYNSTVAGFPFAGSAYVFDLNCPAASCCRGDYDGDGSITNADISSFVAALLAPEPCPMSPACCIGDINADARVDAQDVAGFVTQILGGGNCP